MNSDNNEALSFVSVGCAFFCFLVSGFINVPYEAVLCFVLFLFEMRTFLLQTFHVHEFLHAVRILQPQLHPDEGLAPLQAQLVPGFGPRQQVRDGTLSQTQDGLPEQTLAWRGEAQSLSRGCDRCED